MPNKPKSEYNPNELRPSEMSDAMILQNYPNIWKPLIQKLKTEGKLHPDYSFLNDTRVALWLTGNDPDTGELVNRLLLNEKCKEYLEQYEIRLRIKPDGFLQCMELAPIEWKEKPKVGFVLAVNHLGKWIGAVDLTANQPKEAK
ncbi:MAG: hypothetical protein JW941_05120 [Candidatus Coatesbacteria bacterium]|nr:hypothetical protein [Candidatus Coatesbacteria bacterium]